MRIQPDSKLLFIGDSITDCNRAKPAGEGLFGALGTGYVSLVDAHFGALCPEKKIRVLNMGVSGNTVRDLKARWEADVFAREPDWVSIMIGVNDVWRQFDTPLLVEGQVLPDEYAATLDELVAATKPRVTGIVLMTPFYLEPSRKDRMRARLDEYGRIVKRIATKHKTVFCDTQAAFDKVLTTVYPATIGWDRVHPNTTGHLIAARAFLDAIGFKP